MRIIIDSREQTPYSFSGDKYNDVVLKVGTLQTGDYSLVGFTDAVSIERKSLNDMASTLTRGRDRFERELQRSRSLDFFALVIEADMNQVARYEYRSKMDPKAFIQSLFAFQVRYGLNIVWSGNRERGEYVTYSLLQKYVVEQEKRVNAINNALG